MVSIELELDVTKQKMTGKKEKKKHALSQRVLYKISHLTISSLVVISDKRRGQVNLYHQLETIHLNSVNFSLYRNGFNVELKKANLLAAPLMMTRCDGSVLVRLITISTKAYGK